MPGPRSTSHIKQYTPTQFSAAIAAVSSGSLSIRKAAQAHSIPFSTLQRHFQGTPQAKRSYEASSREMQKLTPEQEENIAMWVLAQENLGLPVKMEDIRRFADRVLEVGLKEGQAQGQGMIQKRGAGGSGGGRRKVVGKDGKEGKDGKDGKDAKDGKDGQEAEGQQQGEEEERSTTTSTVTVGKHWGPKFMQRHPQLKAAREARRKELKKGLRGKQAAATTTTTTTTAAAVVNTPTPAAAATNGHQIGLPQTPTPAVSGGGQRQRNGPQKKNNGQLQQQQQQQQQQDDEDVDPELMDQDQDQTVVMEEVGQDDGDMEDDDDNEEDQNDTVHVKDELEEEEYYEDEQTPDQQLLMDSQRYSRFATTNGSH
ncbi:uncharacterized protein B0T23DRAFT_443121 [Neurospora hispaniola]|uniref:HTH psq-type domain-containing protein n=1 Tax=Neurospora hispaniola TaxID=588809 RepID=A0AAJ0MPW0_9PEZI|nr:hypothetical protein B0T23DRAFT_443121 [Neurospora hispaniola]